MAHSRPVLRRQGFRPTKRPLAAARNESGIGNLQAKIGHRLMGFGRQTGEPRLTIPMPSTGTTPRAESWNVTRALEAYYAAVRFNKLATKGRRYYPDPRCEFSRFG